MATPTLGFEIDGFPQGFSSRQLYDFKLNTDDDVQYISIFDMETQLATKALKLLNKFFVFNPETNEMEEHDIIEDDKEIICVEVQNIIRLEKNLYIKKYAFDCIQVGSTQNSNISPLSGMKLDEQSRVLKTHVFQDESPEKCLQHDDLVVYENKLFIVQDVQWSYYYTPMKRRFLEFSIVKVR